MREAGYKETRVFTPETERIPKANPDRSGITGTVTGFLSNLIPASTRQPSIEPSADLEHFSPPISPLPRRLSQRQSYSSAPHRPSSPRSVSSLEGSAPTVKASRPRPHSHATAPLPAAYEHRVAHKSSRRSLVQYNNPSYTSLHSQTQQSHHRSSVTSPLAPPPSASSHHLPSPDPSQTVFHPRPSRASAYLRHMASQPNIPQRPSSTPVQDNERLYSRDYNDHMTFVRGNGEGEEDAPPPLPRTWLETVARAVVFGGAGAYVGGPSGSSHHSTDPPPVSTPALRQARSIIAKNQAHERAVSQTTKQTGLYRSRSGLSDRTNNTRGAYSYASHSSSGQNTQLLAPPALVSRVGRGRSDKTVGEVRKTQVVCHSAPASRANSQSRASGTSAERDGGALLGRRSSGKEKERNDAVRGRRRGSVKGKSETGELVPSLARTIIEGDDIWVTGSSRKKRHVTAPHTSNGYMSGWGIGTDSGDDLAGTSEGEYTNISSDEDGELDLAQMLVPAKRQNSIKSLRKHLDQSSATTSTRRVSRAKYGSGNSRTFRRWISQNAAKEHLEDDFSEDATPRGNVWRWGGQDSRRQGSMDDDDTFSTFLDRPETGPSKSTSRTGLTAPWTST